VGDWGECEWNWERRDALQRDAGVGGLGRIGCGRGLIWQGNLNEPGAMLKRLRGRIWRPSRQGRGWWRRH
jgi:hypothetical protein